MAKRKVVRSKSRKNRPALSIVFIAPCSRMFIWQKKTMKFPGGFERPKATRTKCLGLGMKSSKENERNQELAKDFGFCGHLWGQFELREGTREDKSCKLELWLSANFCQAGFC